MTTRQLSSDLSGGHQGTHERSFTNSGHGSTLSLEAEQPRAGTIMDLVTRSLLRDFAKEFELDNFDASKQFEIMSAYLTVKRNYSESFNPTDIVSGGGNDLGIDAIAMIINGQLITELDALTEILEDNIDYLDVTFIFVQADRGSFDASKLGLFAYGVSQFFNIDTSEPRNDFIKDAMTMMGAIYDKGSKFKKGNPRCLMYYVTTGTWPDLKKEILVA